MQKLHQDDKDLLTVHMIHIEKCIAGCQNLIDMCSVNNGPECAEAVGICVKECTISIQALQEIIDWCLSQHNLANDSHKKLFEKCIHVCKSAIQHCDKTITQCKTGQEDCIKLCLECITHCTAVLQACSLLLD